MHHEPLTSAQRREIQELIDRIEARRFWRPLTNTESSVLDACHQRIARSRIGGPLFIAEPETAQRRARRHVPRSRRHIA